MQYDAQHQKVPALSRTWTVEVTDRCYGEVWGHRTHTVTISKLTGIRTAEIDGQPADLDRAVRLLGSADKAPVVISEVIPFPASMARCLGVAS